MIWVLLLLRLIVLPIYRTERSDFPNVTLKFKFEIITISTTFAYLSGVCIQLILQEILFSVKGWRGEGERKKTDHFSQTYTAEDYS